MRNVSDESCRENQNRHFTFNNSIFENRAVYEIKVKNNVKLGRPQITTRRMCILCWITKATNTPSEYVIIIDFPRQQWLCEHGSILRYTHIACFVIFHRKSTDSTLFH